MGGREQGYCGCVHDGNVYVMCLPLFSSLCAGSRLVWSSVVDDGLLCRGLHHLTPRQHGRRTQRFDTHIYEIILSFQLLTRASHAMRASFSHAWLMLCPSNTAAVYVCGLCVCRSDVESQLSYILYCTLLALVYLNNEHILHRGQPQHRLTHSVPIPAQMIPFMDVLIFVLLCV